VAEGIEGVVEDVIIDPEKPRVMLVLRAANGTSAQIPASGVKVVPSNGRGRGLNRTSDFSRLRLQSG